MGRYDKIKTWNGSSWVQPKQIKVWNGSSYVDYGANDSDNTKPIYTWNGSSWVRVSLNKVVRQTSTNYTFDSWTTVWPTSGWPENNGTYFSQGIHNCTVPAGYSSWGAYSCYLVGDFGTACWWAGSGSTSNKWYNWYWRRTTPFWVHNLVMRTANSSYYYAQPSKCEFWAGDKVTYIGAYSFTNAGAKNTWFYTTGIDYKPNGGITSFCMTCYDGSGWKVNNSQAMRMGAFRYEGGTAHSTPVYTTYWE